MFFFSSVKGEKQTKADTGVGQMNLSAGEKFS